MKLLDNIAQLATCRAEGGQAEIHPIADAALAWQGDTIRWVGSRAELPAEFHGAEVRLPDFQGWHAPPRPTPWSARLFWCFGICA